MFKKFVQKVVKRVSANDHDNKSRSAKMLVQKKQCN